MKSFPENLRHARTERGLSQEQLAKLIASSRNFPVNGYINIKKSGDNCMISHNEKYTLFMIATTNSVYSCGHMVGVIEESVHKNTKISVSP